MLSGKINSLPLYRKLCKDCHSFATKGADNDHGEEVRLAHHHYIDFSLFLDLLSGVLLTHSIDLILFFTMTHLKT